MRRDAEALTEQWHAAKDDLTRQAEVERRAGDRAGAGRRRRRPRPRTGTEVDTVACSTFEHGRLDSLNALLVSQSPQEFLDQMTALETLSRRAAHRAGAADRVVDRDQAPRPTPTPPRAELAAADEAALAERTIATRKRDAEVKIDEAERLLEPAHPGAARGEHRAGRRGAGRADRRHRAGRPAMRTAPSKLDKPYRWGAEGPSASTAPA